jgi:ribosomal protection tetracycline resistance protein
VKTLNLGILAHVDAGETSLTERLLFGPVMSMLTRSRAVPQPPEAHGSTCVLEGQIPAARVHELERRLPGLTHGEGVLESAFDHYRPITGTIPTRPRSDHNPLNRKEYLLHVTRLRSDPTAPTRTHRTPPS